MSDITQDSLQIARLEERMQTMERDMLNMTRKLDEVLDALKEAKGGWRAMMWIAGAVASVAAAVTWGLQHIQIK